MDSHKGQPSSLRGLHILVTRPSHSGCQLIEGLQKAGATIFHWPLIETQSIQFTLPADIYQAGTYQALFFSSQQAVHSFFQNSDQALLEPLKLHLFAVGSETASAIEGYTKKTMHIPPVFDSLQAANYWLKQGQWQAHHQILWPCGNLPNPALTDWANTKQIKLIPLEVYQTQNVQLTNEQIDKFSKEAMASAIWVFTSPSAIEACQALLKFQPNNETLIACMSGRTAEFARQQFSRCDIVAHPNTLLGMVDAIKYHTLIEQSQNKKPV